MTLLEGDIVTTLDALALAVDGEKALRTMANAAWARGDKDDVMVTAHDASIDRLRDAARAFLSATEGR